MVTVISYLATLTFLINSPANDYPPCAHLEPRFATTRRRAAWRIHTSGVARLLHLPDVGRCRLLHTPVVRRHRLLPTLGIGGRWLLHAPRCRKAPAPLNTECRKTLAPPYTDGWEDLGRTVNILVHINYLFV